MSRLINVRWPDKFHSLCALATVVAISTLTEPNSNPRFDREEADAFLLDFMKRVDSGIKKELEAEPSLPNHETEGFRELAELYHDALSDSIGTAAYTPDVRNLFDMPIRSAVMVGLGRMMEVAEQL